MPVIKTNPVITLSTLVTSFVFISSLSTVCTAAEYYKWTDENGVSHFSERPPQSKTQAVKVKKHAKTPTPAPQVQDDQEPEKLQPQTTAVNNNKNLDPTRCAAEKKRLKTLSSGSRIRMQDNKGGFYYLEQKQIADELKKSRQAISESC